VIKQKSISEAAHCEGWLRHSRVIYFGKKNIGLRFRISDILQVFPVTFGAGANTQDSERMRNLQGRRRGLFFAAVVVVSVFVSVAVSIVVVVVAVVSVADLPL
jgi:hypothetical protein